MKVKQAYELLKELNETNPDSILLVHSARDGVSICQSLLFAPIDFKSYSGFKSSEEWLKLGKVDFAVNMDLQRQIWNKVVELDELVEDYKKYYKEPKEAVVKLSKKELLRDKILNDIQEPLAEQLDVI